MAQAQGVDFQGTACDANCFLVWYPPGLPHRSLAVWRSGIIDGHDEVFGRRSTAL